MSKLESSLMESVEKDARKRLKKKTRYWKVPVASFDKEEVSFDELYKTTCSFFNQLYNNFTEDEKEKWSLNKMKLGVQMKKDTYEVAVEYN